MLDLLHIKAREVTSLPRNDNKNNTWWLVEQGTFKLNYDDETKGNQSPTDFGEVFRKCKGEIIWTYEGNIGSTTNNFIEPHSLEHDIAIAHNLNLTPLIFEGDSTLATQIGKKLQQGFEVHKISKNWHLNKIIQHIKKGIDNMSSLHFQAIRRKGNKFTERLVNEGTTCNLRLNSRAW